MCPGKKSTGGKFMQVSITRKEYKTLLEILEISGWVLHSHKTEKDPRTQKFRDLEQKFFALAADMGYPDFFVYDEKLKSYSPTDIHEETIDVFDYIEEYDDDTFWDKLGEMLGFRDLIDQIGEDAVADMDPGERFMKIEEMSSRYFDEFFENGIKRLYVQK
jgi:hypothetical protein